MVNNPILRMVAESECQISVQIDRSGRARRIITNGPVYALQAVQKQLAAVEVRIVTEQALTDTFNLDMDEMQMRAFIRKLLKKHYKKSERCTTSGRMTTISYDVDCDAYKMKWNREERRQSENGKGFYLKFGFSECDSGCLVVSLHD